ncbi:sigma-70 family RNA polymerase sigma factor [Nocardia sp. NPDC058633]|uniref:sigma-70 family RNA polymerase sigma factor n=1 Tax=Nocardia sp. NPDC058633 TaxID=3346568 RepID=UPI00364F9408
MAAAEDQAKKALLRLEMIERCLPLAQNIARRYSGCGQSYDDLLRVASAGLVDAVDRFQVERGSAFLSFAIATIHGEVRRYFRDDSSTVRVPRRTEDIHQQVGACIEALLRQLGHPPTAYEIAAELDVELCEVTRALIAGNARTTELIDTVERGNCDEGPLTTPTTLGHTEPGRADIDDRTTVAPLLAHLPPQERRVVELRFFQYKNQAEIATELGVSQMHIARTLTRTLGRLRERAIGKETEGGFR